MIASGRMQNIAAVMVSWPFAASLGLLLLNDLVLKSAMPGLITGKLSDFAGIAVVGMLAAGLRVARPTLTLGLVATAFAWWKSPASQPFIEMMRVHDSDFGRVRDYADLIALSVLPACGAVAATPQRFQFALRQARRIMFAPVAVATVLAVTGTSVMTTREDFAVRRVSPPDLQLEAVDVVIKEVAEAEGLKAVAPPEPGTVVGGIYVSGNRAGTWFEGSGLWLRYELQPPNVVSFEVQALPAGLFFGESGKEKADGLRDALKRELGKRFPNLEYVEPLDHQEPVMR